jgi:signal peptidase I
MSLNNSESMQSAIIKKAKKSNKIPLNAIIGIVIWIVLITLVILKLVVFQQVSVVGASMEKNYFNGETLLMNQVDRNFARGQVVAVYRDKEIAKNADYFTRFQATFFLKRVIGLPNEEIEIVGDKVIIYSNQGNNGKVLNEPYIAESVKNSMQGFYFQRTKIPDGNFFLMGDNRTNSLDSRNLGPFPGYSIFGQETVKFWPMDRLEFFKLPQYNLIDIDTKLQAQKNQLEKQFTPIQKNVE